MAKPHKYAWNGIDVETTLSFVQLANMAQRAALESTGDLMHGKYRIASVRSSDRQIEFRINDFLITYKKCLVFSLDFESRNGRTWMSSRIDWYVTTQPTVGGFIPVGAKSMVAHHTYLQFVHNLAAQVRLADPQARVTIREGVAGSAARPAPGAAGQSASAVATHPQTQGPEAVSSSPAAGSGSASRLPSEGALAGLRPPPRSPAPPSSVGRSPAQIPVVAPGGGAAASGLVTSVPGMPHREPQPAQAPAGEVVPRGYASIADQLFAEDEGLFHTRLVQQTTAARPWALAFPDGVEYPLERAVVLGRDPAVPPGSRATQVPVSDPARSVSKTHALLEVRDGMPWLTDLHSTNGTTVTNDVGEAIVCDPGTAVPVGDGWVVGLGQWDVRIVRRAFGG